MSYWDVVQLVNDGALVQRITAAAYAEGIPNAAEWVNSHRWDFASQPGWAAARESYMAANPDQNRPEDQLGGGTMVGIHPGVITDNMILSAVQAIHAVSPSVTPGV